MNATNWIPLVVENGRINFLLKHTNHGAHVDFEVYKVTSYVERDIIDYSPNSDELCLYGYVGGPPKLSEITFGGKKEAGYAEGLLVFEEKIDWQMHIKMMTELYTYAEKVLDDLEDDYETKGFR